MRSQVFHAKSASRYDDTLKHYRVSTMSIIKYNIISSILVLHHNIMITRLHVVTALAEASLVPRPTLAPSEEPRSGHETKPRLSRGGAESMKVTSS